MNPTSFTISPIIPFQVPLSLWAPYIPSGLTWISYVNLRFLASSFSRSIQYPSYEELPSSFSSFITKGESCLGSREENNLDNPIFNTQKFRNKAKTSWQRPAVFFVKCVWYSHYLQGKVTLEENSNFTCFTTQEKTWIWLPRDKSWRSGEMTLNGNNEIGYNAITRTYHTS